MKGFMNMKISVNELHQLINFVQDTRLSKREESNWYLRNIYNSLSEIKDVVEESSAAKSETSIEIEEQSF